MKKSSRPNVRNPDGDAPADSARERILHAAMSAFMERGYAETSTLEIATRAKVSKRELYAQFGSKAAMLEACIGARVDRIRLPADLPAARSDAELVGLLTKFGRLFLQEICRPEVVAVYRLAIAEARRSPQVAQTLAVAGQKASVDALCQILKPAQSSGLVTAGDLRDMAGQFFSLLWSDLIIAMLLGIRDVPNAKEIDRRATGATAAFLRLHGA